MTAFLKRSLTNAVLQSRRGCRYEGRIVGVVPQRVFNKYKFTNEEIVPVIGFEDGWEWIPNLGARRLLTETWGADTDRWIGRRMAVYLTPAINTKKDSVSVDAAGKPRFEKCVEPLPDADEVPITGDAE